MKLFKLSGNSSKLELNLEHPIHLDNDKIYYLGLNGFYSDNFIFNFPNTDSKCIRIFYTDNKKQAEMFYPFYAGFYSISDIKREIMKKIKNFTETNSLNINENSFELTNKNNKILIKTPIPLEFKKHFSDILGIDRNIDSNKEIIGKSMPKLRPFDVLEIHCNLLETSFENHNDENLHKESEILYSFFPNVTYGSKISEKPNEIDYIPIRKNIRKIQNIIITIKDEKGNLINNEANNIVYLRLKSY